MISVLYTYMGSKRSQLTNILDILGDDISTLIEPFAGTACVSINRPKSVKNCYINDYDCHVANVLRSVMYYPDDLIKAAARPRIELDMHQTHDYLVNGKVKIREALLSSNRGCIPEMAGWWVWGLNNWIGSGWCCENGYTKYLIKPDEVAIKNKDLDQFLGNKITTGRGKPCHGNNLTEQLPKATWRIKPSDSNKLTEQLSQSERVDHITNMVYAIYNSLRDCRVLYGDFARVLTKSYIEGPRTGVFLDPPYRSCDKMDYGTDGKDLEVFTRAYNWFIDHRNDPKLRIVFCCQSGDLEGLEVPDDIGRISWSRNSGYAKGDQKSLRKTELMLHNRNVDVNENLTDTDKKELEALFA